MIARRGLELTDPTSPPLSFQLLGSTFCWMYCMISSIRASRSPDWFWVWVWLLLVNSPWELPPPPAAAALLALGGALQVQAGGPRWRPGGRTAGR